MFWAVAGAMSSAQLGITLAPAIRAGLIHGLSVTGANLEESLFRLVAHDHYKDFPDYRYFTKQDDTRILERPHAPRDRHQHPRGRGLPRRREVSSCRCGSSASENGERRFWHEYFYELVQTIEPSLYQGNPDECWLLAAAQAQAARSSCRATRTRRSATSSPRT